MNERFTLLVDPIVQYVIQTQRRIAGPAADHPGLDEVHAELLRLIRESRRAAANYNRPRDYTSLAEYALVYWADELLINSNWIHAEKWRGTRLLEWQLYEENVAGDKFFAKAEAARAQSADALETFFLCVALGFQGRCAKNKERRPRWHGSGAVQPELREWGVDTFRRVREDLKRFLERDDAGIDAGPGQLPGRRLLVRVSVGTAFTVLLTLAAWILNYYLTAG